MSAELQMSATEGVVDFPYKAVSRGAIASVLMFLLALPGLIPTFSFALALTIPGLICGLVGWRAVRRYPAEYSGRLLAASGAVACAALLFVGLLTHIVIYFPEVPDGYSRIAFHELQAEEEAADRPTERALAIDGEPIFLKGYIHPSSGSGLLRQFILVPDLGTCCFGGQPRSSDMIEVTLPPGEAVKTGLTQRKLAGTFRVHRMPLKKSDFDNALFYRLKVDQYQ